MRQTDSGFGECVFLKYVTRLLINVGSLIIYPFKKQALK